MSEQLYSEKLDSFFEHHAGKRVLILGAGREGQGAAMYFRTAYPDIEVTIADEQKVRFALPGVTELYGKKYPETLEEWDLVVVSPGIPPTTPLLATARLMTNATAIFLRECLGTVIMVTGSKGKSTTSSLIYDMLIAGGKQAHFVGNIGISSVEMLAQHNTVEDVYVVETSSYQARLLDRGPGIAVLTELFPEHIDYHGSIEEYYRDKLRVTTMQSALQLVIYNAASTELCARVDQSAARPLPVPAANVHEGASSRDGLLFFDAEEIAPRSDCKLLGEHNTKNILLAITAAKQLRVENEAIAQALKTFKPLPHRLELIGTYKGVTFVNDSLATTPEATLAALRSIDAVQTIFLGGLDRGYDFTELIAELKRREIKNIILFPDSGKTIREQWGEVAYGTQFFETESMREAVEFAYANTPSDGVALLSCAAPSYSIFKNYEDRGDQFRAAVEELGV